jgi:hypothetical protein
MKTWLAVVALGASTSAWAAGDRIVVLAPPGATGVRAQLTETLCLSEECVAPEQVLSAGKLDLAKVARQHVVAVVTGHAVSTKKGPQLELLVLAPTGKAKLSEKVDLNDSNRLAVNVLVTASAKTMAAIDGSEMAREESGDGQVAAQKPASKPHHKALAKQMRVKASHRLASRPHAPGARG